MNRKILAIVLVLAAFGAGLLLGPRLPMTGPDSGAAGPEGAPAEKEILYWVAPMDPNFRRDGPGKSPMGMDLVPVYADEVDSQPGTDHHERTVREGHEGAQAQARVCRGHRRAARHRPCGQSTG